jgi:hypothetical protein
MKMASLPVMINRFASGRQGLAAHTESRCRASRRGASFFEKIWLAKAATLPLLFAAPGISQ